MGTPSVRILREDGEHIRNVSVFPVGMVLEPGQMFSFHQQLERYIGSTAEVKFSFGSASGYAVGDKNGRSDCIQICVQGQRMDDVLRVADTLKEHFGAIDLTPKFFSLPELTGARDRIAYLWRWILTGKTDS